MVDNAAFVAKLRELNERLQAVYKRIQSPQIDLDTLSKQTIQLMQSNYASGIDSPETSYFPVAINACMKILNIFLSAISKEGKFQLLSISSSSSIIEKSAFILDKDKSVPIIRDEDTKELAEILKDFFISFKAYLEENWKGYYGVNLNIQRIQTQITEIENRIAQYTEATMETDSDLTVEPDDDWRLCCEQYTRLNDIRTLFTDKTIYSKSLQERTKIIGDIDDILPKEQIEALQKELKRFLFSRIGHQHLFTTDSDEKARLAIVAAIQHYQLFTIRQRQFLGLEDLSRLAKTVLAINPNVNSAVALRALRDCQELMKEINPIRLEQVLEPKRKALCDLWFDIEDLPQEELEMQSITNALLELCELESCENTIEQLLYQAQITALAEEVTARSQEIPNTRTLWLQHQSLKERIDRILDQANVNTYSVPTSRDLSAGSSALVSTVDPADNRRGVESNNMSEQLQANLEKITRFTAPSIDIFNKFTELDNLHKEFFGDSDHPQGVFKQYLEERNKQYSVSDFISGYVHRNKREDYVKELDGLLNAYYESPKDDEARNQLKIKIQEGMIFLFPRSKNPESSLRSKLDFFNRKIQGAEINGVSQSINACNATFFGKEKLGKYLEALKDEYWLSDLFGLERAEKTNLLEKLKAIYKAAQEYMLTPDAEKKQLLEDALAQCSASESKLYSESVRNCVPLASMLGEFKQEIARINNLAADENTAFL